MVFYFTATGNSLMACIHACPQKAIGMTIPEHNPKARYRNEHITLQEIMQSNSQKQKG